MKFVPAKYYRRGRKSKIDLIVIHTMEYPERLASAEWCAGFFQNPMRPGNVPVLASAHYCVDSDTIVQCVKDEDTAWHAGPVNDRSIGVEHAGYAGQTTMQWDDQYSRAMLDLSAELVAGLCHRHEIPASRVTAADLKAGARSGICGHKDVTDGLQGGKGHWDPGPNFPWDLYMQKVVDRLDELRGLPTTPRPAIPPPPAVVSMLDPAAPLPPVDTWVRVVHAAVEWLVCPVQVAPVGIGEARNLAARHGCELPSPGLIDAIWRAADVRVNAWDVAKAALPHDGTPRTMNAASTHAKVAARVRDLAGTGPFRLLAGAFKDVASKDGKIGLYGWHDLNGKVIQPFFAGHAMAWKDYSQGWRPAKRA